MNNMDIAAVLAKRRPQLALKRLMDVVISGCALLVLGMEALAVWLMTRRRRKLLAG